MWPITGFTTILTNDNSTHTGSQGMINHPINITIIKQPTATDASDQHNSKSLSLFRLAVTWDNNMWYLRVFLVQNLEVCFHIDI